MSIVPNIEEDRHDDLCFECGRDLPECICRDALLPDDFDPLGEERYDPDWDDYTNDLIGDDDADQSTG